MEPDEHWLHSHRRQVVKVLGHLLDARRNLALSTEHAKLIGSINKTTQAIESNIDALHSGIDETVKLCAHAAEDFKRAMQTPDAKAAPITGNAGRFQLTPFQRALAREGTVFETMPIYVPTPSEKKIPKILAFTLKQKRKPKSRRRTKDNIPL